MKKNQLKYLIVLLAISLLSGCGQNNSKTEESNNQAVEATAEVEQIEDNSEAETEEKSEEEPTEEETLTAEPSEEVVEECPLEDGTYVAVFDTDSSMFHVNEADEGKGILTVKDGLMTIHISLTSKNIVNLYPGLVEDATKDGAVLLEPTVDTVTYSDGMTEEVHGFDVPVPYIDKEFDLALIGSKGKWYDHKVIVSNPVPGDDIHADASGDDKTESEVSLADGEYLVDIAMEGGSGKATIESPAKMVKKDGQSIVTIKWSSPHYDYMLLDGVKYEPVNTEGNSVFELPISEFGTPVTVIGNTTAMSKPHEVEYKITCTIK